MRLIFTVVAVSLALAATARAEAPFSFGATPGKLPKTVVPTHYAIDLRPDLEKLTGAGSEVGDIEVRQFTDSFDAVQQVLGHEINTTAP